MTPSIKDRAVSLRLTLLDRTATPDGPCAVLLSAGVDSNTILAAALENGLRPLVISFRVSNRVSRDWSTARRTAKKLNLDFLDIEIPDSVDKIMEDIHWAAKLGLKKKADIECAIPIRYAIDAAAKLGIKTLFSGAAADGHYALSRKAVVEAHKGNLGNPDWLDLFRSTYFARKDPAQAVTMRKYANSVGVTLETPYIDNRIIEALSGSTWAELNKPRQKMPARLAFPEIETWGVDRLHVNLQLGDSGIAENFEKILKSEYNTRGSKSVIGIYNEIAKNYEKR